MVISYATLKLLWTPQLKSSISYWPLPPWSSHIPLQTIHTSLPIHIFKYIPYILWLRIPWPSIHAYSPSTSLIPCIEPIRFHEPKILLSTWYNSLVNFCLHHINILSRITLSAFIALSTSYSYSLLYHISTRTLKSSPFGSSLFISPSIRPYLFLPVFARLSPVLFLLVSTIIFRFTWP